MTRDEAGKFVDRWRVAAPALANAHREELQSLQHSELAQQIDELLAAGLMRGLSHATTGMVEMQRLFARARR